MHVAADISRPPVGRPGPSPTTLEAPPALAKLFRRWMAEGQPYDIGHALEEVLWAYRGRWLLAGDWVFYLAKSRDFCESDVIRVVPRSMPYPPPGLAPR